MNLFHSLHILVRTPIFQGMSPNNFAFYFRLIFVQVNRFSKYGWITGQIVPFYTAYFPKTVPGVASNKQGLDIPQPDLLITDLAVALFLRISVQKIVFEENVSHEVNWIKFIFTI